jgi:hypothetical protein
MRSESAMMFKQLYRKKKHRKRCIMGRETEIEEKNRKRKIETKRRASQSCAKILRRRRMTPQHVIGVDPLFSFVYSFVRSGSRCS